MSKSTSSVQVAVRMRCFIHAYEVDKATMVPHKHVKKIIRMDPPVTIITHPETGQEKNFTYDFSYDSFDSKAEGFASQETVWKDLGYIVLDNAWEGPPTFQITRHVRIGNTYVKPNSAEFDHAVKSQRKREKEPSSPT